MRRRFKLSKIAVWVMCLSLQGCAAFCNRSSSGYFNLDSPFKLTQSEVDTFFSSHDTSGTLLFPQIAAGDGYATVVTLMHVDARATAGTVTGTLRFHNPDGSPRVVDTLQSGSGSQFVISIPKGGVRQVTVTSTAALAVGSARFDTLGGTAINGVSTFTVDNAVVGVPSAASVTRGWVPLNARSGFSNGIALQNPENIPVNVRLNIIGPTGQLAQSAQPTELNPLPANGQYARFIGPEMGFTGLIEPNSTLELEVIGSGSVAALPLVLGNGLISSSSLITQETETPVVFSQVVDGGGYQTALRLFNPSNARFTGTLRFYNADGTPKEITLILFGRAREFSVQIPPRGTLNLETSGVGALGAGMARIDSVMPLGGAATIFFGQNHVGVPPSSRMRSAKIAVETRGGFNTGLAVSTVKTAPFNMRMTLFNREGVSAGTVQPAGVQPLGPNRQYARYVTEMGFANTTDLQESSIVVESVGGGVFTPLALLDRNGVFSTTAVARQTLYSPTDFAGTYSGPWTIADPPQQGSLTLTFSIDTVTNRGLFTLSGNGPLGTAGPETFTGDFRGDGYVAAINSPVLGTGVVTLKPDGTLILRATGSQSVFLPWAALDGEFDGNRFVGTIEADLGPAFSPSRTTGTFTLTRR